MCDIFRSRALIKGHKSAYIKVSTEYEGNSLKGSAHQAYLIVFAILIHKPFLRISAGDSNPLTFLKKIEKLGNCAIKTLKFCPNCDCSPFYRFYVIFPYICKNFNGFDSLLKYEGTVYVAFFQIFFLGHPSTFLNILSAL